MMNIPLPMSAYQLLYFRSETRENEQMMAVAPDLKDDDIRDLAAYVAPAGKMTASPCA